MPIEISGTGFMIWEFDLLCLAIFLIIAVFYYKRKTTQKTSSKSEDNK